MTYYRHKKSIVSHYYPYFVFEILYLLYDQTFIHCIHYSTLLLQDYSCIRLFYIYPLATHIVLVYCVIGYNIRLDNHYTSLHQIIHSVIITLYDYRYCIPDTRHSIYYKKIYALFCPILLLQTDSMYSYCVLHYLNHPRQMILNDYLLNQTD
jgi:hypothetical protein